MFVLIKRVIVFFIFFLLVYISVLFTISNLGEEQWYYLREYTNIPAGVRKVGSTTLIRFQEIQKAGDADILFVGSSHCMRGFDPRFYAVRGINTFNMASVAQTPLNSYYLLKRYNKYINPKLVVFEIYWGLIGTDGVESTLDIIRNSPIDFEMIEMVLATHNINSIHGFLHHLMNLHEKSIDEIPVDIRKEDKYIPGGFVETTQSEYSPRENEYNPEVIYLNKPQIEYIKQVIEMFKKHNVQVLLVTTPVAEDYRLKIKNYEVWTNTIEEIAHEYQVPFWDLNLIINLDHTNFFDVDHLNQKGVRAFNEFFYHELQRTNLLVCLD